MTGWGSRQASGGPDCHKQHALPQDLDGDPETLGWVDNCGGCSGWGGGVRENPLTGLPPPSERAELIASQIRTETAPEVPQTPKPEQVNGNLLNQCPNGANKSHGMTCILDKFQCLQRWIAW